MNALSQNVSAVVLMTQEIDYEHRLDDALRGVVRDVLEQVSQNGLPGEHHFYVTFRTGCEGASLPERLRERYPSEMTIVLQHQFWNLLVEDSGFAVTLRFDGLEERIEVPWEAVTVFADPSAEFGLQLRSPDDGSEEHEGAGVGTTSGKSPPDGTVSTSGDASADVVNLDDFRR